MLLVYAILITIGIALLPFALGMLYHLITEGELLGIEDWGDIYGTGWIVLLVFALFVLAIIIVYTLLGGFNHSLAESIGR